MNKQRKFYEEHARKALLDLRVDKDVSYVDLVNRLRDQGVLLNRRTLTNKLNRGRYTFTFALQVLAALGETSFRVPQLPVELRRQEPQKPQDESL